MHKVISLLFLLAISGQAHTQSLVSSDSLQIVSKIDDWDRAWNIKDPILATKWYSEDARFTNAFGDKRNGQKEIEALQLQMQKIELQKLDKMLEILEELKNNNSHRNTI